MTTERHTHLIAKLFIREHLALISMLVFWLVLHERIRSSLYQSSFLFLFLSHSRVYFYLREDITRMRTNTDILLGDVLLGRIRTKRNITSQSLYQNRGMARIWHNDPFRLDRIGWKNKTTIIYAISTTNCENLCSQSGGRRLFVLIRRTSVSNHKDSYGIKMMTNPTSFPL